MGLGVLFLLACQLPVAVERNCEERQAYYPDDDEDGVGDEGRVYIGCAAPSGWVLVPPTATDTASPVPTAEPGPSGVTGDTARADTGKNDTDAPPLTGETGDTAAVRATSDTAGDTTVGDTAAGDTQPTGTAPTAETGTTTTTAHTGASDTALPDTSSGDTSTALPTGDTGP